MLLIESILMKTIHFYCNAIVLKLQLHSNFLNFIKFEETFT